MFKLTALGFAKLFPLETGHKSDPRNLRPTLIFLSYGHFSVASIFNRLLLLFGSVTYLPVNLRLAKTFTALWASRKMGKKDPFSDYGNKTKTETKNGQ